MRIYIVPKSLYYYNFFVLIVNNGRRLVLNFFAGPRSDGFLRLPSGLNEGTEGEEKSLNSSGMSMKSLTGFKFIGSIRTVSSLFSHLGKTPKVLFNGPLGFFGVFLSSGFPRPFFSSESLESHGTMFTSFIR